MRIDTASMPITRGVGQPPPAQLRAHLLFVQLLDRLPIPIQFFGAGLDRRVPTASADGIGQPFRIEHGLSASPSRFSRFTPQWGQATPPDLKLQGEVPQAAGQSAPPPRLVERKNCATAFPTGRRPSFRRRRRPALRACGAPKNPGTSADGTKPGKRYAARNCRRHCAMRSLKQVSAN